MTHSLRRLVDHPAVLIARACVARFAEVQGFDRALAFASKCFIALIPIAIIVSALTSGRHPAESIISRYGLHGDTAESVRELFASSSDVRGGLTFFGLAIVLFSGMSLARGLQRLYEHLWRKEPAWPANAWRPLAWVVGFGAFVALSSMARDIGAAVGGSLVVLVAAALLNAALWMWTPRLLLGGRVDTRRLVLSGLLAAAAAVVLGVGSKLWMPTALEQSADRYGLIGIAFAFVSWLYVVCVVIVASAVIGSVITQRTDQIDGGASKPTCSR